MAKIVSFNTDAPCLKTKGEQPTAQQQNPCLEQQCYQVQVTSEYLSFAGRREFRAYVVTASSESRVFTQELPDKAALLGLFLDVLKTEPDEAVRLLEKAERGEVVSLQCPIAEPLFQAFFAQPSAAA